MDPTPPAPPPPLSAVTTTTTTVATTQPDSLPSSPRSRHTDSWGEDPSLQPPNNPTAAAPPGVFTKLRLMCSYGGHIIPRPHDKSLCYVGGDTRIVVVDRHTTLADLKHRLSKTLLRSSSPEFTLKYQLPSEDLDSLISVTTDEDLENMIEEYERLNSSRLRLFLFPNKPESVSSIGSILEDSTKSEDWFLNALNGATSDTSSVNCLLGLDDNVSIPEKKDANSNKGVSGKNSRGNNSGQDIHSVPDSPMLETTSSFGSASSSPSLAHLPPLRVQVEEHPKVGGGGIEEQFSQMSVHQKVLEDGGLAAAAVVVAPVAVAAAAGPVVVAGAPLPSSAAIAEYPVRLLPEEERSEQGLQMAYLKQQQLQQQQHQKQSTGFDLPSPDSVSSDGSLRNPLSRQKPPVIYQDPIVQIQPPPTNNTILAADLPTPDPNTRIQMPPPQIQDSAYVMSLPTTQVETHHPQLHHQPQFIHPADPPPPPPPQYIHHHPSAGIPMTSYYPVHPSQSRHHHHAHHPPLDQPNFVYYMPARQQAPQAYNLPLQPPPPPPPSYTDATPAAAAPTVSLNQPPTAARTAGRIEPPTGVYRPTNPGAPQLLQVPSTQQLPPQYIGYSQIRQPAQSVAQFIDPSQQPQHIYYAAQPLPPLSAAQYQTMTSTLPVEAGSQDNSMKQPPVRTSQP